MTRLTLAALLALSLSTGVAFAETVAPAAAALSPYTATRLGHKPRNARAEHCARKADGIGVEGKARAIYLRKLRQRIGPAGLGLSRADRP